MTMPPPPRRRRRRRVGRCRRRRSAPSVVAGGVAAVVVVAAGAEAEERGRAASSRAAGASQVLCRMASTVDLRSADVSDTPEFNLAAVHEAIAAAVPDRECIVFRDRRLTYAEVTDRTRRLAHVLARPGLGARPEAGPASPATSRTRTTSRSTSTTATSTSRRCSARTRPGSAPFNVNYRYVAEELRYLLADSGARAIVYHSAFAPTLAEVLPDLPDLDVLLQVADDSGHDLLPGRRVVRGGAGRGVARPAGVGRRVVARRPLHPLHRRHHRHAQGRAVAPGRHLPRRSWAGGTRPPASRTRSIDERSPRRRRRRRWSCCPAPPFMHGAGHWIAFLAINGGNTVVIQDDVDRLDPADICAVDRAGEGQLPPDRRRRLRPADRRRDGDGRLRPLVAVHRPVGRRRPVGPAEGAVPRAAPHAMIIDGSARPRPAARARRSTTAGGPVSPPARSRPARARASCAEDLSAVLEPGHDEIGWLAKRGRRAPRLPRRRGQDRPHLPGRSTASATRCPATGPGTRPTARSSCSAATR